MSLIFNAFKMPWQKADRVITNNNDTYQGAGHGGILTGSKRVLPLNYRLKQPDMLC